MASHGAKAVSKDAKAGISGIALPCSPLRDAGDDLRRIEIERANRLFSRTATRGSAVIGGPSQEGIQPLAVDFRASGRGDTTIADGCP